MINASAFSIITNRAQEFAKDVLGKLMVLSVKGIFFERKIWSDKFILLLYQYFYEDP